MAQYSKGQSVEDQRRNVLKGESLGIGSQSPLLVHAGTAGAGGMKANRSLLQDRTPCILGLVGLKS